MAAAVQGAGGVRCAVCMPGTAAGATAGHACPPFDVPDYLISRMSSDEHAASAGRRQCSGGFCAQARFHNVQVHKRTAMTCKLCRGARARAAALKHVAVRAHDHAVVALHLDIEDLGVPGEAERQGRRGRHGASPAALHKTRSAALIRSLESRAPARGAAGGFRWLCPEEGDSEVQSAAIQPQRGAPRAARRQSLLAQRIVDSAERGAGGALGWGGVPASRAQRFLLSCPKSWRRCRKKHRSVSVARSAWGSGEPPTTQRHCSLCRPGAQASRAVCGLHRLSQMIHRRHLCTQRI